ncbi:MAG: hypothetical protein J6S96_00610 [Muribaculaceae bacterium]|nr:hypothetical protein [Muribaculaceae bacterium]
MIENKNNEAVVPSGDQPCKTGCQSSATRISAGGCGGRCNLRATNWLEDVPGEMNDFDMVEVHFKNTRRGFYRNSAGLDLHIGDMVAVEANPGHDIGEVAMTGKLVKLQMKRANLKPDVEILRVFRKAKPADLERYEEAKAREVDTMIRSRQIAVDLGLKMKIGDVEYQGDGNKAIFYYIADERVDFRQLIKVLAEVFRIRVEMKQIGARQEAGRIGGIGPCGRPLCCASWMTSFVSVATNAARFQDISLNPQKLAGQCAKLKCCINFEVDTYVEAGREMPSSEVVLETRDRQYFHFKTDVLKREISYSTKKGIPENLVTLPVERVYEVISLNENGIKPDKLALDDAEREFEKNAFGDILGQDAINRFDKKKKKKSKKNRESHTEPEQQQHQLIDAEVVRSESRPLRQRDNKHRQPNHRKNDRKMFRPRDNGVKNQENRQ